MPHKQHEKGIINQLLLLGAMGEDDSTLTQLSTKEPGDDNIMKAFRRWNPKLLARVRTFCMSPHAAGVCCPVAIGIWIFS